MSGDRRARWMPRAAAAAFALSFLAAAVVPGDAWSPGSRELSHAPVLTSERVLYPPTGLSVRPVAQGVLVSTGDGGGAGTIAGIGTPVRVRAGAFRGIPCWEIGSEHAAPATYVDDNGIRLDDGMIDRLRARGWLLLLALASVLLVWRLRR